MRVIFEHKYITRVQINFDWLDNFAYIFPIILCVLKFRTHIADQIKICREARPQPLTPRGEKKKYNLRFNIHTFDRETTTKVDHFVYIILVNEREKGPSFTWGSGWDRIRVRG